MRFHSPRFGGIEVDEEKILRFRHGLPGFPDCTGFIVMDHDQDTPLKWLQCVDRPEVAFLVVEPEQVLASYEVEVPPRVLDTLEWEKHDDPRDIAVFVILNVQEDSLTANLRAPVIVNIRKRLAFQMIQDSPEAPLQQRIAPS
ncbi:MAG: flagellar assembly protein FliW [Myxococcota bacterium]